MTREALLRELQALPAEDVASILRELLERGPAESMPRDLWLEMIDRLIAQHRPAWEHLAQR